MIAAMPIAMPRSDSSVRVRRRSRFLRISMVQSRVRSRESPVRSPLPPGGGGGIRLRTLDSRLATRESALLQRFLQVVDDVAHAFDADRQPDAAGRQVACA